MNKKWTVYLIILALGVTLFLVKKYQGGNTKEVTTRKERTSNDPASEPNRNHGFDRRVSYIEYTRHAECRMQCRNISQREVEEIMRDGKVNYNKSDVNAHPCPTYALEGTTSDGQRVRIVFAQCDLKTKVVTCIDLGTDWECHCPGDETKYKNRN